MKPSLNFGNYEANCIYKAEGCQDLPTLKGQNFIISAWEIEPEDIEKIKENGVIYLMIYGGVQPPVYLTPRIDDILDIRGPK